VNHPEERGKEEEKKATTDYTDSRITQIRGRWKKTEEDGRSRKFRQGNRAAQLPLPALRGPRNTTKDERCCFLLNLLSSV
jgi:hypothetical protein